MSEWQEIPLAPPPVPPEPPAPRPRRVNRTVILIGVAVAVLGIWLLVARLPGLFERTPGASGGSGGAAANGEARRIQATLYYVADNGIELVPVVRDALYAPSRSEQVRRIVEAQIAAPPEGRVTAIAEGTTVREVFLSDRGEAFVDLGGAIVSGHSGGSLNEALAVYAIVNAVTVNLPDITAVQILVEGKQVDTLVGHLDLRSPLRKALDLVQKGS